jgi:hypothetical protein
MYPDLVNDVTDYEAGRMEAPRALKFFARLANTETLGHLQSSYQRTFRDLVERGFLTRDERGVWESSEPEL